MSTGPAAYLAPEVPSLGEEEFDEPAREERLDAPNPFARQFPEKPPELRRQAAAEAAVIEIGVNVQVLDTNVEAADLPEPTGHEVGLFEELDVVDDNVRDRKGTDRFLRGSEVLLDSPLDILARVRPAKPAKAPVDIRRISTYEHDPGRLGVQQLPPVGEGETEPGILPAPGPLLLVCSEEILIVFRGIELSDPIDLLGRDPIENPGVVKAKPGSRENESISLDEIIGLEVAEWIVMISLAEPVLTDLATEITATGEDCGGDAGTGPRHAGDDDAPTAGGVISPQIRVTHDQCPLLSGPVRRRPVRPE
jgi:hypothetical protein